MLLSTPLQSTRASLFARVVSATALLVGASVLAGWWLDLPALTSLLPAGPKMVALTALAFVLAAGSLWFHAGATSDPSRARPTGIARRRLATTCAALVILIGLVGLIGGLLGWNPRLESFSIERLPLDAALSPPAERMSVATALGFILLGTALLLARSSRQTREYQACAIVVLLIGWLGFSRYVYGGEPLVPYAAMALHTSAMFLLLGAGTLSLRTDAGLIALLASDRAGGFSVRRLLPAAVLVPLVAGWLALYAEQQGWLGAQPALSLFALSSVIVLAALVWINGVLLERADLQREHAQRALSASEERTHLIIESALDAVISMDKEGVITGWSTQAESLFGWTGKEAIGRSLAQTIIPERYREAHRQGLRRYLETGEARVLNRRIELSALHREQREFPVEIAITPIGTGTESAFSAFVRDITERRRSTQALRESQQLLQAVIDNSMAVIYVKDLAGRYVLVNRRFEDIFRLTREAILGRTDHDLFAKEAADAFRAMDQRVAASNDAVTAEETAPQHDGPHTYLSVKAPLQDETGKPYAVFGISTDITDRKRNELDLRSSEERLRAHVDRLNLLDRTTRAIGERQDLSSIFHVVIRSLEDRLPIDFGCMCLYDAAGQRLTVSHLGAKSHERAAELGIGEHASIDIAENGLDRCVRGELIYESDTSTLPMPFPTQLARGGLRAVAFSPLIVEGKVFGIMVAARSEAGSFTSGDCEFLRQLSQHVALAAHQAQLYSALQRAYDDLRQSQQTVMQQERLRALSLMASGIAHDINNALSPAALYAQSLLERETTLSTQAHEYLMVIQRAIEGVATTVARMREFYRPREPELVLASVDLNRTLQQVLELTRARWSNMPQEHGAVIHVQTDLQPDLPRTMGADSEIRDALTNLILNAVDAMPNGGTLTLHSRAATGATGTHVLVEIRDTGIGMSAEVRSHCLEPFFTTKGERGTGLGLAMVYGMIQRHSGELEIDSQPGAGTTMRLIFPAKTGVSAAQQELRLQSLPKLRLLIVDDDPLLLQSLDATLAYDGHAITVADGGQAGIDVFTAAQAGSEPFSAVITDLGMPNVDGRAVAAAIKSIAPATPIILLTGWGHRLRADNELPPNVDRVLSKPPKLADLRATLAELTVGRGSDSSR